MCKILLLRNERIKTDKKKIMLIKTILNRLEKFKSFVYGKTYFKTIEGQSSLIIELKARKNSRGICSSCGKACGTYDTQAARCYEYVPLWGIRVYFHYRPRRVHCKQDGVHIEQLPWSEGKEHLTKRYQLFLSTWAKRLSWKEVSTIFKSGLYAQTCGNLI